MNVCVGSIYVIITYLTFISSTNEKCNIFYRKKTIKYINIFGLNRSQICFFSSIFNGLYINCVGLDIIFKMLKFRIFVFYIDKSFTLNLIRRIKVMLELNALS